MSNLPNVSRTTLDVTKRYFAGAQQQGQPYFDWDINEKFDTVRWWVLRLANAVSEDCRIQTSTGLGFSLSEAAAPTNNIKITLGMSCVSGRLLVADSDFDYTDESANFIAQGSVSTKTELVPATTYKYTDDEKLWTVGYSLPGCRIKFTSGSLTGQYFTITGLAGQSLVVTGDTSLSAPGDTYSILPPAISTPSGATQTDNFYLVSWWEDVSPIEDTSLEDPAFQTSPSHRYKLKYAVHKDWAGVSSNDPLTGHSALLLGSTIRSGGDTDLNTAEITNQSNSSKTLYKLTVDLGAAEASIATVLSQNLDSRLTSAEASIATVLSQNLDSRLTSAEGALSSNITDTAELKSVINLLEYSQASNEGIFISTDYTTANIVYNSGKLYSKNNAAHTTAPNIIDVTGATLVNNNGNSFYTLLNVDATDDSYAIELGTSSNIDAKDLVLTALHSTVGAPSFTVDRAFPMSERIDQKGFDWILNGATTTLSINPGWAYRWGTMYQSPDKHAIDASSASNWTEVAVPGSNSWSYLYMTVQAGRRDLIPKLSLSAPKWNGEHPTVQGFLVGIVYYKTPQQINQVCRNNTVYFDSVAGTIIPLGPNKFVLATETGINGSTAETTISLLNVPGALSFKILYRFLAQHHDDSVNCILNAKTPTMALGEEMTLNTENEHISSEISILDTVTYVITHPNNNDTSQLELQQVTFDPLYTPDTSLWRA